MPYKSLKVLLPIALGVAFSACSIAQEKHYEPTIESLDSHPLPQWYADAKLGIFIHWGLYSVPGWAPVNHPDHDFGTSDYAKYNPYAEWYYNTVRIAGSPTEQYDREHYGPDHNYYDFKTTFNEKIKSWDPAKMAAIFRDAGAKYVVLTTKHHEGFTLWPSKVRNINQPGLHASRDIVGELTEAVRADGMKMGLYYSGGFDWTFNRGPIEDGQDGEATKPETKAYGDYAFDQAEELIRLYHPAVLWNDIDWPKTGRPLQLMADYYNAIPDGVLDDRFGVPHSDFTSPEYSKLDQISPKKWEECRGLGLSFGINRAEDEKQTIAPQDLIELLVDIVSKNGNLLLDVGPEVDGSIPAIQMDRLEKLGAWLKQNGDAIYGTKPWTRANGTTNQVTSEGKPVDLRFTQKDGHLYATLFGKPTGSTILLHNVTAAPGSEISLLGDAGALKWKQKEADLEVTLPSTLPGNYAYVLKLDPAK
ncbi:alpha-L-fucosidase [Acidicapsa dinghuensis]|uniref:alpha-L-fucosidase n=1 Tax=Acidicapsa dinghuensis TaxID=2218256 RepID=A0ABW1EG83_9BACT|nr:alpha-L-fucosidase [Acidicapsa dinghuensis]